MELLIVFSVLALILYFATMMLTNSINVINYDYVSLRYTSFKFSMNNDSPIGLNILIKVLFPPIFITIVSGILYNFGFDKYVVQIYWVVLIYFCLKWFIICVFGRRNLIDWKNELICSVLSFVISIIIYIIFISKTKQIFVTLDELRDGIWVGILSFFFTIIFNFVYKNAKLDTVAHFARVKKYICSNYSKFQNKYGKYISSENEIVIRMVYAIMIYEDYNRPSFIRILEHIKLLFCGNATLGVMQVTTGKFITDVESVQIGSKIIEELYNSFTQYEEEERLSKVAFAYNKSSKYRDEVMYIYTKLDEIDNNRFEF